MTPRFALGLDFGTNSLRVMIVNVENGRELTTVVRDYARGEEGVILSAGDPDLARQHPSDYLDALETCAREALDEAGREYGFTPDAIIGIGVDATGSTPLPVDAEGRPLAFQERFEDEPAALAWLWKDHTAHAEAAEITEAARKSRPQFLAKCGGAYSAEWFWAKILRCRREAPEVFAAAHTWVELSDWIPALLTGSDHPARLRRNICAAGHKAMYHPQWGGWPDAEFLADIDSDLIRIRETLPVEAHAVDTIAGALAGPWAERLGLPAGIPVAMGLIDAHAGAIGSGIAPGTLVKIMGTSSCDMLVAPIARELPDIPGLCGIAPHSILPGHYGLEAGQSAVGDIFHWFVTMIRPGGDAGTHGKLSQEAERLRPGASGLLALDWHNGNRSVLADPRLSGGIIGLTLKTTPAEIYRALVEGTAFGARVIMERFEEYGCAVERIVNCGGISAKNAMVLQIYADVLGRPLELARSTQACALGAAICGAVAAGTARGGHADFAAALAAMTGAQRRRFTPDAARRAVYDRLYALYKRVHDAFGARGSDASTADAPADGGDLYGVMKELLAIRDATRS